MKALKICVLSALAGLFLSGSAFAQGATKYSYDSVANSPTPGVAIVAREMLETKNQYSCDTIANVCIPIPASSTIKDQPSSRDPFEGIEGASSARKKIASAFGNRGAIIDARGRVRGIDLIAKKVVASTSRTFAQTAFSTLSPDGRWLAFYQTKTAATYEKRIVVVSLDTGKVFADSRIEKGWDVLSEANRMFSFSADSTTLYYLSLNDGYPSLFRVMVADLKDGSLAGAPLISKKYTVADFLADSADRVFFVANRESPYEWALWSLDSDTSEISKVAGEISYGQDLLRVGESIVFARTGSCGVRAAYVNERTLAIKEFPIPESGSCAQIRAGSQVVLGGVPSVVSLPDDYSFAKKYPVFLWLHGGPYRQASLQYHSYASYGAYDYIFEQLRRSGAIIVKPDYRGSFGFGNSYADSLRQSVGNGDVADIVSVLSAVRKKYSIGDAYAAGVSYGGYLALRTTVAYPKMFSGAVSINGVTDWSTLAQKYSTPFEVHFGGDPGRSNASLYEKASISSRVGRLSTEKIVLIAGKSDTTVPYWQTASLYEAFVVRGKKAQLLALEGEGHVLKKSSSVFAVCSTIFTMAGINEGDYCSL